MSEITTNQPGTVPVALSLPTVEEFTEEQVNQQFAAMFNQPKCNPNVFDDDLDYDEPYRFLMQWYLLKVTKSSKKLVSIPSNGFTKSYELHGHLKPVIGLSNHAPIKVVVKNLKGWSIDRSSETRGVWVESSHAFYRLLDPDCWKTFPGEQHSMNELHYPFRAKFQLLSNLIDLFCDDKFKYVELHVAKKPQDLHQFLTPPEEVLKKNHELNSIPFDLELLKRCPGFIKQHLMKLHSSLNPACPFMQGLDEMDKQVGKYSKNDCFDYIESAMSAESRGCRYPYGDLICGPKIPQPNRYLQLLNVPVPLKKAPEQISNAPMTDVAGGRVTRSKVAAIATCTTADPSLAMDTYDIEAPRTLLEMAMDKAAAPANSSRVVQSNAFKLGASEEETQPFDIDKMDLSAVILDDDDREYLDSLPELSREAIIGERFHQLKKDSDMRRALRMASNQAMAQKLPDNNKNLVGQQLNPTFDDAKPIAFEELSISEEEQDNDDDEEWKYDQDSSVTAEKNLPKRGGAKQVLQESGSGRKGKTALDRKRKAELPVGRAKKRFQRSAIDEESSVISVDVKQGEINLSDDECGSVSYPVHQKKSHHYGTVEPPTSPTVGDHSTHDVMHRNRLEYTQVMHAMLQEHTQVMHDMFQQQNKVMRELLQEHVKDSMKMSYKLEFQLDNLGKSIEKIEQFLHQGRPSVEEAVGQSAVAPADQLSSPVLIKLLKKLQAMEVPLDRPSRKFHNAFSAKYLDLLLYYQKHNNSKVKVEENKVLYEFVKNQKTNIRLSLSGQGPFAKEPKYIKLMNYLGVRYGSNSV